MAMKLLRKAPVLHIMISKKPFLFTCDALPYGIDAVLSHQIDDGEQPIVFHSRNMFANFTCICAVDPSRSTQTIIPSGVFLER